MTSIFYQNSYNTVNKTQTCQGNEGTSKGQAVDTSLSTHGVREKNALSLLILMWAHGQETLFLLLIYSG